MYSPNLVPGVSIPATFPSFSFQPRSQAFPLCLVPNHSLTALYPAYLSQSRSQSLSSNLIPRLSVPVLLPVLVPLYHSQLCSQPPPFPNLRYRHFLSAAPYISVPSLVLTLSPTLICSLSILIPSHSLLFVFIVKSTGR